MSRQRGKPEPPARRPALIAALVLGLAGVLLGAAALLLVVTRGASPDSCRMAAWRSLPSSTALPPGWAMSGSGIYIDSVGTTLTGPQPTASDATQPAIFVSVGCYGVDAAQGLARSHEVALSGGSTDISFPVVGDESFALRDTTSGQYTVFVRRGELVASLASTDATSVGDLETAARAVDSAMSAAAVAPTATDAARASPGGSPPPTAAASASPEETTSHAAADLERQLPAKAGGVTFAHESYAAGDVLGPADPGDALTTALQALGKTTKDLVIAEAYDESGAKDIYIDAFRITGVSGAKLSPVIVGEWLGAGSAGTGGATATVGGKKVTKVSQGDGGPTDYVYVHGDVVFDVGTSDAELAKTVLAALP
jgi:hypothetical protein